MTNVVTIVLVATVFSVAAAMHSLTGFGFSLISVGILSLLIGPKLAVPLVVIASAANCIYLMWLLRRDIMFKEVIALVVICALFTPVGSICLRHFNKTVIMRFMGLVILVVSFMSLLELQHLRLFAARPFKWLAAAVAGVLGGAFDMPGPPLVLYAYNCDWPVRNAMANLQFVFAVLSPIIIISFGLSGLLNRVVVGWGIAYTPLVCLFTIIGSWISKRLSIRHLNVVINVLLVLLAISLVVKG
ncbi:MAG: TSUP family transporter [Planctomycetota bacterium]